MPAAMRRLASQLFTFCSAISLVLLIATIAVWLYLPRVPEVVHYSRSAKYECRATNKLLILTVSGGSLQPNGSFRAPPGQHWNGMWANPTRYVGLGVWHGRSPANDPTAAPYFGLVIPFLLAVFATALLPALWVSLGYAHLRRQRRSRINVLCPICSYDLRAHKPGDHCPECGTAVANRNT
jgi:hypothetical protein